MRNVWASNGNFSLKVIQKFGPRNFFRPPKLDANLPSLRPRVKPLFINVSSCKLIYGLRSGKIMKVQKQLCCGHFAKRLLD